MPRIATGLITLLLAVFGMTASAQSPVTEEVANTIRAKLEGARPDFTYGEVRPSPMEGLYQVRVEGGPLLYVNASGDFIITGTLYGVMPGGFVDLKELALKPERQAKLASIEDKDLVIFPAEGKRKAYIHVFTDVDCGFCRKLHREVPALNAKGIEVRYLAYPRAGIGSNSHQKIAAAWCADDRLDAMNRLKAGQRVNAEDCTTPVAQHFQLGGELGVTGTPAIVLADGTLVPGYMTADQLAARLGL